MDPLSYLAMLLGGGPSVSAGGLESGPSALLQPIARGGGGVMG